MRTFLAAVSFLTIIPAPAGGPAAGRAGVFFPLVGAMIGGAGAGLFLGANHFLNASFAALVVAIFWSLISDVLHDGKVGMLGIAAIAMSFLIRWQALQAVPAGRIWVVCVIAQVVPRAAVVTSAWLFRPSGVGKGFALSSSLNTTGALLAAGQGIAVAMLSGWRAGLVILAVAYLIIRLTRAYFYQRIGGVNADCLGATQQFLEAFILILFASPFI